jgi:ribosome-binding factor A
MLGSTIQKELAVMILRELQDPRLTGFPTITRVKVSDDLSIADVYVTIMGTPGQQTAALNALKHSAGLMRTRLTKSLSIRVAPFLKFHMDESLKKELAVLDAIRKAREEDEARAAASGSSGSSGSSEVTEEQPKAE